MPKKTKSKSHKNRNSQVASETPSLKNASSSKQFTPKGSTTKPFGDELSQSETGIAFDKPKEEDIYAALMAKFCDKRKAFTKFVMTSGIKAGLVRAFVALYEDTAKPDNVIEYIQCFLGADFPSVSEIKTKQNRIREMQEKINKLEEINDEMKLHLEELEMQAHAELLRHEMIGEEDEYEDKSQGYENTDEEESEFDACDMSNLNLALSW